MPNIFGITLLAAAIACGGGNDDSAGDNGGNDDGGGTKRLGTGALVYTFVDDINGQTENAVHVLDLASGNDNVFAQEDFAQDDVNASTGGTIAQIIGDDDSYTMLVTDKTGSTLHRWDFAYELTFVVDGPQISPDGTKVAFTLRVPDEDGNTSISGGRTIFVCPIEGPTGCKTAKAMMHAGWTPDGRLIGVSIDQTSILISDAGLTTINPVSSVTLDEAEFPVMTPDGKYVVFDRDIDAVYALEVATGALSPLTKDGVNQFKPTLSPDGKYLAFQQQCCSANAIPTVYVIPFDPTKTVSADYDALEPLKDNTGDIVNAGGRLGWY